MTGAAYFQSGKKLAAAVREAYGRNETDYKMEPLLLVDGGAEPVGKIRDGDTVFFCCRRGEREIELTDAFTAPVFPYFDRPLLKNLRFVLLTMYHEKYTCLPIAFAPSKIEDTLAACIARAGKRQFHCAESEKFAHVTYFFNGGNNRPFPNEDDVRIPSPRGVPFETVPELSLPEVAQTLKQGMEKDYDFIVANYANGDVIGHTSSAEAKLACASSVSRYLGEAVDYAQQRNYITVITADHGNLEILYTGSGQPHVAHTSNLVPFILIDPETKGQVTLADGSLADVAPTILAMLGLEQPALMSGRNLVSGKDFGKNRKVLLIILDGWGIGAGDDSNPVFCAPTPEWDALLASRPAAFLKASGEAVGLGSGKPGNSEAGHINIGAGRIIIQDDVRLDRAMEDGSFEKNAVFLDALRDIRGQGTALHLLALLTKKSSHGSIDYPLALLRMARAEGIREAFVHIIFDGRSTEPGSAPALLEELDARLEEIGLGTIVDGVGRGLALDRDGNYGNIQKVYEALVLGRGRTYC
jgi:2,3-bisphosphoglycerate-independent phosphoglycerate mutase